MGSTVLLFFINKNKENFFLLFNEESFVTKYFISFSDLQLTYASQVEKTLSTITPLTTCPHNSNSNDSTASNNDRPQAGFVNKETADKYSVCRIDFYFLWHFF